MTLTARLRELSIWRLAPILLLVFLSGAPTAWSYVRSRTDNGIPVAWTQMPITYYVGRLGSGQIKDGSDIQAIKDAFSVWANVDCARVSFVFGGLVENPRQEYNNSAGNQNHIFWVQSRREWPYPQDVLAVTKVSWNPISGEIRDADIAFNGYAFQWSTSSSPATASYDVMNTAVHEIGHFLGLEHSSVADATMFGKSQEGESKKRDLATDDRDGLCNIYPKNGVVIKWTVVDSNDGLTPCPKETSEVEPGKQSLQGCQSVGTTPLAPEVFLPILFCFILCYAFSRSRSNDQSTTNQPLTANK